MMKTKTKFIKSLGYFGISTNKNYNKKVIIANKLVDEYNEKVHHLPTDEQMSYQFKMKKRMLKIIKNKNYERKRIN